ncbi:JmjC domain-containing protein [Tanacetum coccineum]
MADQDTPPPTITAMKIPRSSDDESTLVNDRFTKSNEYHVVPPPITGNPLTLRADISFAGLDEYAFRNKIIESKTTETNKTVGTTNEATIVKPTSINETVVSKSKINRDEVIIEDWTSDDKNDVCAVKTVSSDKPNVTQAVRSQADKSGQTSQKQGINFKKVHKIKACFVCKSTGHLIKDCDFYDQKSHEPRVKNVVNTGKKEVKPVWRPKMNYQDHAVVDSGCSSHMTSNKAYLSDYEDFNGGFVAFRSDPKGGYIVKRSMDLRMDRCSPGKYNSSMVFHMANLKCSDKHNMVAFLKKPNESVGFTEVVVFLKVISTGDIVPLLPAMLAGAAVDQGEGSTQPAEPHHTPVDPIPSTSQLPYPPHPSPQPHSPLHQSPPHSPLHHSPYQSPPHSPHHSPPQSSPHILPPRSYEAPLHDGYSSGSAEDSVQLKELMVLVPKLVTRINSLEKELKDTKQTLGNAVLKLVKKVKTLETALKRKSKKVLISESEGEESEDQGRKFQDIDDDPLVSLVRESMKEKSTDFVTPTKASGEAHEEEISPTILEAAKTLSKVASQGVSKEKSTDKGKRYRRRARSMAKKIDTGLDAEEEINTGREEINTGIEEVSTGSTKVDSGTASERGQREGKAPMIDEDIQATHKTKEQLRQEEAGLEEAIKLQAQLDEEVAKQIHLDKMIAKRMAEEEALTEQQKKRKAQVQFEAQFYTEEDWDTIRAKLEANAELSKDVLGQDFPEQDFAKRMVDMVNQRKKHFAEERAKAKRNKPMTQAHYKGKIEKIWRRASDKNFKETKDVDKMFQLIGEKVAESAQEDSETDKEESVEAMNPTLLTIKSDNYREDLYELYRLVMQKYGTNRPEDAYDRVLWSDLRTMFDPPLIEDAIWSLPLQ